MKLNPPSPYCKLRYIKILITLLILKFPPPYYKIRFVVNFENGEFHWSFCFSSLECTAKPSIFLVSKKQKDEEKSLNDFVVLFAKSVVKILRKLFRRKSKSKKRRMESNLEKVLNPNRSLCGQLYKYTNVVKGEVMIAHFFLPEKFSGDSI